MIRHDDRSRAPRWALILTPPGQRKSDEVFTVAAALAGRGLRLAGFAQQRRPDAPRRYMLCGLGSDDVPVPIARRGGTPGPEEEPFCGCVFIPDAFATARTWLARDLPACDVAVLDEISRLEVTGGGHAEAVAEALARAPLTVLSVRANHLSALMDRFELPEPLAVLEQGDPPEAFLAAIVDLFPAASMFVARGVAPSLTETR